MVSYICFESVSLFSLFTPITLPLVFPGPKLFCSSTGQIMPSVGAVLTMRGFLHSGELLPLPVCISSFRNVLKSFVSNSVLFIVLSLYLKIYICIYFLPYCLSVSRRFEERKPCHQFLCFELEFFNPLIIENRE